MSKQISVRIENGQFCGRDHILAKTAIEMIQAGAAIPAGENAIRLTFSEYYAKVEIPDEKETRQRALCNSSTRAALSTTQREELYQGLRRPGHGQTPTDGPVTKVLTVMRKYRAGVGFINWGENERFARRRFNPDKPKPPRFATESQLRAALALNPDAFGLQKQGLAA